MNLKDKLNKAYGLNAAEPAKTENKATSIPAPSNKQDGFAKQVAPKNPINKTTAPGGKNSAQAWQASESFIKSGLRGIEKAAKFLLLLGQDEAAAVLRHLKPMEVENLSREIAKISQIDTKEANEILTEFGWLAQSNGRNLEGGPEAAQRMLAAAFGEEKAREMLLKAVPDTWHPFEFLNDFTAKQLVALLHDESSQVMALILPYLDPKLASSILTELNKEVRTEIVRRIARMERMDSQVLMKVEAVLRDKIAKQGRPDTITKLDGASILAGILRHAGAELEDHILSGLDEDNPELSEGIRDQLFTTDDILRVGNKDIQKGLRNLNEREVALLLKGKSQEFKDKLLSNISSSKRTLILEEYDILGTVRRDDVAKITKDFVAHFKERWEAGTLTLEGDEDLVD
ncbi:MAG: flagellar motor switch protein FliG [Spirochaetes bacterium]|nr:flagellar motor switch protein FliG [Spirochaetota bacterium]MBU0955598.1 flagellar motor switch protein FliG [Spirochaetota bacterium]